jgi:hypothetical protein
MPQPNPLRSTPINNVKFSRHARFRLNERGIEPSVVRNLLRSPTLDYRRDKKTGHFVSHFDDYYVVWRQDANDSITILTIMRRDEFPH